VASALFVSLAGAQAQVTFYTSSDAWNNAVNHPQTDDLNNLGGLVGQQLATPTVRQAGGYGYGFYAYDTVYGGAEAVQVGGTAQNAFMTVPNPWDILIIDNITGNPNAFGVNLFGVSAQDNFVPFPVTLEILDAKGRNQLYTFNPGSQSDSFIGVISDAAIQIINVYPALGQGGGSNVPYIAMDNVTFSDATVVAVPEPSALALMLGGLGLVGFVARRRAA